MILIVVVVLVALAALLWWLIVTTEGVYLGRAVVIWLYDVYARRYDNIKQFQPQYEHWLVAAPLMKMIASLRAPLVLDVATGTGRLPEALLSHIEFQGRVVGLDLSRKMLQIAAEKLSVRTNQVSLIWGPAEALPFEDDLFDIVTCLESLEFMRDPAGVLCEMIRVLRPGGVLFISNRINVKFMPGKIFDKERLIEILAMCGVYEVDIEPWQEDYQRVWGMKTGQSPPTGARLIWEILRCPHDHTRFQRVADIRFQCECGHDLTQIDEDGIINLFPLYA